MISLLSLFEDSYEGEFLFMGQDIKIRSDLHTKRAQSIEILTKKTTIAPHLTVMENMKLHSFTGDKHNTKACEKALKVFGLDGFKKTKAENLSIPQQQFLVLARTWMRQPELLIVDEPEDLLTEEESYNLLSALQQLHQRGVAIVLFSSSRQIISSACRFAELCRGQLHGTRSQKPRSFFGNKISYQTEKEKIQSMMSYMRALEPINSVEDYIDIIGKGISNCVQIWTCLKKEWLDNQHLVIILEKYFPKLSPHHQMVIFTKVCQKKSLASEILLEKYFKNIHELPFAAEDWLYFIRELPTMDQQLASQYVSVEKLFSHKSEKVRADAVKLLNFPLMVMSMNLKTAIMDLLKDNNYRVVSNTLDYLQSFPFMTVDQLRQFNFNKHHHHRVRASWCIVLKNESFHEEVFKITEELLASKERTPILAAVWVLAHDKNFKLSQFFEMESELNPHIFVYTDDIIRIAQSVKAFQSTPVFQTLEKQSA